jgi:SAM-dependent methyltransferase
MNPAEYDRMAELELTHWWYVGVRDLFARLLKDPRFQLPLRPNVLDAGCGSGAHLQLLGELLKPGYLGGFDFSDLAVGHARIKNPGADVYQSDLCQPETHVDELDLLLCCDVLYTTPLEEGTRGLLQLCNRLRPGGLLLLHLPAFNWLKSHHDLAVHTRQRFTTEAARELIGSLGLQVELLSYRMFLLFPAIVIRRLPSLLFRGTADSQRVSSEQACSDLRPAGASVNRWLTSTVQIENRILARGIRFPWGSSIVAVGRKP